MKRLKVGLNGFGRIGRAFARIALERDSFDIVAVNTRKTKPAMLAYLLQYDSVYRTFSQSVRAEENAIVVNGKKIHASLVDEAGSIPWGEYGVDVVVDATGAFTNYDKLKPHLRDSVKKVVLTAPAKDDKTCHVVLGTEKSDEDFMGHDIISNASCTTNCAALLFKVLNDHFGVEKGFLTTAHAYTASQSLLDEANKTETRSRAAALSIIPTTTGAAKTVTKVIPELKGKVDGLALRIPVPVGSFTDVVAVVNKEATIEAINKVFQQAAEEKLKEVLAYATVPLVSSDYIGSPYSCIFDPFYTNVIGGTLVKVCGWYDNEWGYSVRLVDLVERLSRAL